MVDRLYKTNLQLALATDLRLIKLGPDDDWGLYVGQDGGLNTFGTPLMLRGPRQEVIDFLVDRNLTGNLEF